MPDRPVLRAGMPWRARASWLVVAASAVVPDGGVAMQQVSEEPTAAECLEYLHNHMPDSDKRSPNITDSFLSQNVDLALQARAATPWGKSVPKAIFRAFSLASLPPYTVVAEQLLLGAVNDVLPYAVLSEPRGLPNWNWRPLFLQQLGPRVASSPNMSAAVELINTVCWSLSNPPIKFLGSPNCAINSYAPLQTLSRGNSSCTGLAIYVVAALRSVGIPARVAGTPHWNVCGGKGKTCAKCPKGDLCTPGHGSSDDACGK